VWDVVERDLPGLLESTTAILEGLGNTE
jgi:hypothetical protein